MIWYLKARGWMWTLIAAVGMVPAAGIFGPTPIPVPDVVTGLDFPLPISVLLPCVPAWLVMWNRARGEAGQERTAVRFPAGLDLVAVVVVLLSSAGTAVLLASWFPLDESAAVVRNGVGYVALALALRTVAAPAVSTLAVTVLPVFCAAFGTGPAPDRAAFWWAWPLQPGTASIGWFLVSGIAVVAVAAVCAERSGRLLIAAGTPD